MGAHRIVKEPMYSVLGTGRIGMAAILAPCLLLARDGAGPRPTPPARVTLAAIVGMVLPPTAAGKTSRCADIIIKVGSSRPEDVDVIPPMTKGFGFTTSRKCLWMDTNDNLLDTSKAAKVTETIAARHAGGNTIALFDPTAGDGWAARPHLQRGCWTSGSS